ncbi:MAG: serpin family protein [Chloroflexota bacterium]
MMKRQRVHLALSVSIKIVALCACVLVSLMFPHTGDWQRNVYADSGPDFFGEGDTVYLPIVDLNAAARGNDEAGEISPTTVFTDITPLAQLVADNSDFAIDLYHELIAEEGNLIYSPYSISSALAMVYAGARGETEQQMTETMHFSLTQELLHPTFKELDLSLMAADQEDVRLSIANALWKQFDHAFLDDYLNTIAENYRSEVQSVDFVDTDQREAARETINTWTEEATEGKIQDLIGPGVLDEYTRLVLTNAIYFNAKWESQFPEYSTFTRTFTLLDGSQVDVPTMRRQTQTAYTQQDTYELLELPYREC